MKKVVGLGACVLDTLINCETYPQEDTKKKADSIFLSGGGPVGNALVVISKLGVSAEVIGGFGSDNAGKYLIEDFEKYGVKTQNATVIDGATSFTSYVILAVDKASRTCIFDRGTVKDEPKNLKLSALDDAYILHLDGNYLQCAISATKYAKERGVLISLDAGGLYAGIEELLPLVDILIPSAEFALGITGEKTIPLAMEKLYNQYHPQILVVTDGKNGGYYYENGKALHYDSIKVKAVDTNGAGDTFHGAFITAFCGGKSVRECCDFASAVSAYKCTNKGARTYPLTMEKVAEFISKNK
jgi:sugar/nucleoside kinase (ribokinase family)